MSTSHHHDHRFRAGLTAWRRRVAPALAHLEPASLAGIDERGDLAWVLRHQGLGSLWRMVAPAGTAAVAFHASCPDGAADVSLVVVHPCGIDVATGDGPISDVDPSIDIARRILGLGTAPERLDGADLAVVSWLELVLEAVADPRRGPTARTWATLCALHPGADGATDLSPELLGCRTRAAAAALPWETLRRGVAQGDLVVAGAEPADAAWMDAPMFARVLLSAHRDVNDLRLDIELFVNEDVSRLIRRTVEATDGKVRRSGSNESRS